VSTEAKPSPGRHERRRAETRARLLTAARELFAEQGADATRINEITDRADVGFGSFYNYFRDKDAIVEAVVRDMTEEHGAAVDQLTAGMTDAAEIVAVAHRHFVRLAVAEPTWGRLVLRLEPSHRVLSAALGLRARRDLEQGIASGRFAVPDPRLMLATTGGALLGAIQGVIEGHARTGDADENHAEAILRMLGVPADEAHELAHRHLGD
jgi:AcrR family transcriptional regulator